MSSDRRQSRRFSLSMIAIAGSLLAAAPSSVVAQEVTIKDLVEVTDIDGLSISPDGRFAVFRTERADVGRNTFDLRWYSADLKTGTVKDIGSGGDSIYLDPGLIETEPSIWASDSRSVIVKRLIDGAVGLWRVDVDGHKMVPLVVGDADVADYSGTDGGRAILYTLRASRAEIERAEKREYDSGILVDSTVDLTQNLFRGAWINGRMASQRYVGSWRIRDGLLWNRPRQQHRLDLLTGSDVPVGKPEVPSTFQIIKNVPKSEATSGRGGTVVARIDGSKRSLSVTLADGRTVRCGDPVCASHSVASFVWLPSSRRVLLTLMDLEHRESLYLWDVERNALRKVARNEGLLSGGRRNFIPCAVSDADAICVASGAASPPQVERISLSTGERTTLFDPNSQLRSAYRPKVSYLEWDIGGGKRAGGVVMQAENASKGPAPLYLNYYSCDGFLRGGEGDEWPMPQLLAAGYVVACVNSVAWTGPQIALNNYKDALAAVQSVIGNLNRQGIVDPSKVAMGGLSFGSEAAFYVAIHSHLLTALSVTSPQFEPASYWVDALADSDLQPTIRRVWKLGPPDETPREWKAYSAALNTDRIRIPVLFQMPEQESRRTTELVAKLHAEGTPTELYAFPDEMHLKVEPRHKMAVYQRNLDWFRYWLEDYRDPDPTKADQYQRWNQLRARWNASKEKISKSAATAPAPPSH